MYPTPSVSFCSMLLKMLVLLKALLWPDPECLILPFCCCHALPPSPPPFLVPFLLQVCMHLYTHYITTTSLPSQSFKSGLNGQGRGKTGWDILSSHYLLLPIQSLFQTQRLDGQWWEQPGETGGSIQAMRHHTTDRHSPLNNTSNFYSS